MGFSFSCLSHAPVWDLGVVECQKLNFFEHGHVAYQIEEDDE